MQSVKSLVDSQYSLNEEDEDDGGDNHVDYGGSRRGTEETKPWDKFRILPAEDNTNENSQCLEFTIQCLKVVAYIVTFLIVLGGSVISKSLLLLATSVIGNTSHSRVYCRNEWDKNHQYNYEISIQEKVPWIWCIAFMYIVPEFFTFFRSLRITVFKSVTTPGFYNFSVVALFELLHAVGISLFVFVALPYMDVIKGTMVDNATCFVPALLLAFCRTKDEKLRFVKIIIDCIAIFAQLSGLILWPVFVMNGINSSKETGVSNHPWPWSIPVSLVLISCGWWENYVDIDSPNPFVKHLAVVKDSLRKTRYFVYIIIPILKTIVFLASMIGFLVMTGYDATDLFTHFGQGFYSNKLELIRKSAEKNNLKTDNANSMAFEDDIRIFESTIANTPMFICIIQILLGLFTYITGKFTCRICIQAFSYAFPINLAVPVTVSLLITACGLRSDSPCFLTSLLPKYVYWECPNMDFMGLFIYKEHNWVWLLWLLSQTWVTLHIWTPKCERLANTETLYVTPMYSGVLTDQSLALNRRRTEEKDMKTEVLDEEQAEDMNQYYETIVPESEAAAGERKITHKSDYITKIYACATMWHETAEEMTAMLKSVLRMDEDQSARRNAQKYLKVVDPDYYELETHIFFDDAFEISDEDYNLSQVNGFVKLLVNVLDEAASTVHEIPVHVRPPEKFPTPYGGRMVWVLPGKTKLYAHLKDKMKIRHRKRWSQVMYMYYLLGHRLMEQNIATERKAVIAENTFLLTLDGDIDFKPQAVQLLVDLMKKNHNLGAACGRIHPIGSGPMVWYQKFEYAIGHWLQKATEHMIGCVLCSPGCFSLFRAKGLMDDNVMRRYTTTSNEARHYVQYDQGEDRWLCTLLLQRGYRVEYSAASDAYTHAPEGFGEFFNQRRRWVPSTMANILDLLMDSKKTINVNDNISLPYIMYQGMLMAGTILGPGTIFLMLVGAFVAAFRIDNWTSFYANLIPIMLFMVVCFVAKPDHQLLLSQVLTCFYALVMMAVIVGTLLQVQDDGWTSPGTLFLIAVTSTFVIAALAHPQEISCIYAGFLYYLLVPSMYLLLIIYSGINMFNVNWGTREVKQKKTKEELEEEKKQAEEMKKNQSQNQIFNLLGMKQDQELQGGFTVNCANLCSFLLCTTPKSNEEQLRLIQIQESIKSLTDKVENLQSAMETIPGNPLGLQPQGRRKSLSRASHRSSRNAMDPLMEGEDDDQNFSDDNDSSSTRSTENQPTRNDMVNPFWIEDKELKKGPRKLLPHAETEFWENLLEKYLKPIDENAEQKKRIQVELKELRNKAVFAFFMFNSLFVLIVFLLQLHKDNLYVEWPLGVKYNITVTEDTHEVRVHKEYLHLEPIGLVFVFFFALIIIIQFVAMLFHRFGTLSHILASTELTCCQRNKELSADHVINKNAVAIARNMQKLKGIDYEDSEPGSSEERLGRRKTIHNLEKSYKRKQMIGTLDVAFRQRWNKNMQQLDTPVLGGKGMNKDIRRALQERRDTMFEDKQKMQTLGASNNFNKVRSRHRNSNAVPLAGAFVNAGVPNGSIRSAVDNVAFENDDNEVRARSPSYQSGLGTLDSEF